MIHEQVDEQQTFLYAKEGNLKIDEMAQTSMSSKDPESPSWETKFVVKKY